MRWLIEMAVWFELGIITMCMYAYRNRTLTVRVLPEFVSEDFIV